MRTGLSQMEAGLLFLVILTCLIGDSVSLPFITWTGFIFQADFLIRAFYYSGDIDLLSCLNGLTISCMYALVFSLLRLVGDCAFSAFLGDWVLGCGPSPSSEAPYFYGEPCSVTSHGLCYLLSVCFYLVWYGDPRSNWLVDLTLTWL